MSAVIALRHGHVELALHALADGSGVPLLALHELGGATGPAEPEVAQRWPGPVFGLDFTGHGRSSVPAGGGYTAEVLVGDADAALAHLGRAVVWGSGLGAYVALLLAGARPGSVPAVVLADGAGLDGGDGTPVGLLSGASPDAPDPYALAELASDVRAPEYAAAFAAAAQRGEHQPERVFVVARATPPWLVAVCAVGGVRRCSPAQALGAAARLAQAPDPAESARGRQ